MLSGTQFRSLSRHTTYAACRSFAFLYNHKLCNFVFANQQFARLINYFTKTGILSVGGFAPEPPLPPSPRRGDLAVL